MRLIFPFAPTGVTLRDQRLTPPAPPLRILLVDDDPLVLRSLRDSLELEDHDVATTEGGQAGIDEFAGALEAGKPFDIVITDLGMPYVDGRKVAARIRQLDAKVPIVMLTGWGHRLIATDDKPEHVDRVLSKPPKMSELRATLAELTRRRKAEIAGSVDAAAEFEGDDHFLAVLSRAGDFRVQARRRAAVLDPRRENRAADSRSAPSAGPRPSCETPRAAGHRAARCSWSRRHESRCA